MKRERPTLQTVADAAGVSKSLASFALNGRPGVSDENRDIVLRVARELGYVPDAIARELRTGTAAMFGLIVRNVENPFFNDLLIGMQEVAFERDISIIAVDSRYSIDRERRHIRSLAARRVGGLAIAPVGDAEAVEEWRALRPGARTVLVNSSMKGDDPSVMHVSPDNDAAVTKAFEHLHALGHRRIAFLTAPPQLMSDADRYRRYTQLCAEYGVSQLPLFSPLQSTAIVEHLLAALDHAERPTAIITNSDFSANYIYTAAQMRGLRIGFDLSVVGHDDLDTSAHLAPGLTTLRLDRRALGSRAFARLTGEESGNHVEPVTLVERASSGPPRA